MKHKRNKRTLRTINITQKSELKGGARAKGGMTLRGGNGPERRSLSLPSYCSRLNWEPSNTSFLITCSQELRRVRAKMLSV